MDTKTIEDRVRSLESFAYRTGEDLTDIKTTLTGHTGQLAEIHDRLGHVEDRLDHIEKGISLLLGHHGIERAGAGSV
ncbi:hypothetical protein ACTMTF_31880 [Nonomuraea sp. ZG12]|uniref:hypothetical protein n=1 Tax=Nonomuraea sp. ZG12 TaxID=3452207 RepID=UPI003F8914D0